MTKTRKANSGPLVLAAVLTLSFGTAAIAQQAPMPISRTSTITLTPEHAADFVAAAKQYNEIYAKIPDALPRAVYQSLTGQNRYRITISYPDFAGLDAPQNPAVVNNADLARINMRILSFYEAPATVLITERLADLSTPQASGPPNLLRISRTGVRPDKVEEWRAIMKNELLPAYKKAGRTLTVRQVRFGGSVYEFHVTTRVESWADAGKNHLRDSMGAEAYDRMVAKLQALTTYLDRDIFRYRADLSYVPPAK